MLILVGGGLERLLILLRMLATSRVEVLISTWVLLLWLAGSRPRLRGYHPLKRFLGRDISRKHALWLGVVTREHTALTAFELLTIDLLFLCQDVGSFLCTSLESGFACSGIRTGQLLLISTRTILTIASRLV
jgi:hypothetical protein